MYVNGKIINFKMTSSIIGIHKFVRYIKGKIKVGLEFRELNYNNKRKIKLCLKLITKFLIFFFFFFFIYELVRCENNAVNSNNTTRQNVETVLQNQHTQIKISY